MNSRADWVTLAVAKDNFCSCKYALTVHAMTVTLVHILLHESHLVTYVSCRDLFAHLCIVNEISISIYVKISNLFGCSVL